MPVFTSFVPECCSHHKMSNWAFMHSQGHKALKELGNIWYFLKILNRFFPQSLRPAANKKIRLIHGFKNQKYEAFLELFHWPEQSGYFHDLIHNISISPVAIVSKISIGHFKPKRPK